MNENAIKILSEIRNAVIEKYALNERIRTKNNIIYRNEEIVLIENIATGDLKIKRNLR